MLDREVSACFKNIIKSDDIALDIGIRVVDAVTDSRLCSQIDDDLGTILLEGLFHELLVGEVSFDEHMVDWRKFRSFLALAT